MSDGALAVVETLLTARVYERTPALDEGDLPPNVRQALWEEDGLERPLPVDAEAATTATGVEEPWDAVSGLMFTDRDAFSGRLELVDEGLAAEWYLERADAERLESNPVLAYEYGDEFGVDYDDAREENTAVQADRAWIDSLLAEYFDEDDEEMLDLVDVRAPEEVELTLDDVVLTAEQEAEIDKIRQAIAHRDYLADIGLREIGKLLFVGPPGTGKTSTARGLASEMDLPFVEVKLSMITSQYLGETAKNVEKVFEVAKRLSPCILFMDEFDFVAKTRDSDEHAAIKRAVNTLLKSIDEVSLIKDEVLLIGATNHPDQLDAAAWRRFDEILHFPKPDEEMRAAILELITSEMDLADFDARELAAETEGLTGSDLRLVLREAVLAALVEGRTALTQQDLHEAIEAFEERDNLKNLDTIEDSEELMGGSESEGEGDHDDHAHAHQD
jgi:ATP-dependent 26S proteasome regulatory subunit